MWDFRSPNKDEIFALEEWSFNYWTDSEELESGWVAFFIFFCCYSGSEMVSHCGYDLKFLNDVEDSLAFISLLLQF